MMSNGKRRVRTTKWGNPSEKAFEFAAMQMRCHRPVERGTPDHFPDPVSLPEEWAFNDGPAVEDDRNTRFDEALVEYASKIHAFRAHGFECKRLPLILPTHYHNAKRLRYTSWISADAAMCLSSEMRTSWIERAAEMRQYPSFATGDAACVANAVTSLAFPVSIALASINTEWRPSEGERKLPLLCDYWESAPVEHTAEAPPFLVFPPSGRDGEAGPCLVGIELRKDAGFSASDAEASMLGLSGGSEELASAGLEFFRAACAGRETGIFFAGWIALTRILRHISTHSSRTLMSQLSFCVALGVRRPLIWLSTAMPFASPDWLRNHAVAALGEANFARVLSEDEGIDMRHRKVEFRASLRKTGFFFDSVWEPIERGDGVGSIDANVPATMRVLRDVATSDADINAAHTDAYVAVPLSQRHVAITHKMFFASLPKPTDDVLDDLGRACYAFLFDRTPTSKFVLIVTSISCEAQSGASVLEIAWDFSEIHMLSPEVNEKAACIKDHIEDEMARIHGALEAVRIADQWGSDPAKTLSAPPAIIGDGDGGGDGGGGAGADGTAAAPATPATRGGGPISEAEDGSPTTTALKKLQKRNDAVRAKLSASRLKNPPRSLTLRATVNQRTLAFSATVQMPLSAMTTINSRVESRDMRDTVGEAPIHIFFQRMWHTIATRLEVEGEAFALFRKSFEGRF